MQSAPTPSMTRAWSKRPPALDLAGGLLDQALVIEGVGADCIFAGCVGHAKQNHRGNSQRQTLLRLDHRLVYRELKLARHGLDRIAHVATRHDEQRKDERVDGEMSLTNHLSQRFGTAHSARTIVGILHTISFAARA